MTTKEKRKLLEQLLQNEWSRAYFFAEISTNDALVEAIWIVLETKLPQIRAQIQRWKSDE